MIPTTPTFPNPFQPWEPDTRTNTGNMWQCSFCGQWIGNMQYHNCPGTIQPQKTWETGTIESLDFSSGLAELSMYGDFKRLIKADAVRQAKDIVWEKFKDDKDFPLDAVMEVLDGVENNFRHGDLV